MERSRTGHPDPLLLQAYADGELSTAEAGGLEAHLRGCAGCRAELTALQALLRQIGTVAEEPLRRDLSRPVEAALRRRQRLRTFPWVAAVELTAGLAVGSWAWPLAERSLRAILPVIQAASRAAANGVLTSWAADWEALQISIGQALRPDLPGLLPSLGLAQAAIMVAAGGAIWVSGNFLLLRRGAAR